MSKTSKNTENGGNGQRRLTQLVVVAAIAVFGLSGWAWWHNVRSNPERTLYAAIENNFRMHSLTRQVTQGNEMQKLEQDVLLATSPKPSAHGFTAISQSGEIDATVRTESISTMSQEFVRYTEISTSQKNEKDETLNFDELLNIWGKTSSDQTGQPGELFGESVLGAVPTANLSAKQRKQLMKTIHDKKIYNFDEKTVERKTQNGRPTYIYDVTVAPTAYIELLKQFGGMVGMKQLESLDPQQYADSQPLQFKLTVDVWSQRLTGIEFAGGERVERMNGFGIRRSVDLPKESIPVEELQTKLQQAQQ